MSTLQNPPRLFPADATAWTTEGLGVLSDAISCTVTEERNGQFELTMVYPLAGQHFGDIAIRSLILAKPDPLRGPEPFRVYSISKPMSGRCTVRAAHLSYDLSGVAVAPFSSLSLAGALQGFTDYAVNTQPFTFTTDMVASGAFNASVPASVRSWLGGTEGSILDCFGGEWEFTGYTCKLWYDRGSNNGVTIEYGKNMTDLRQDEENSKVYTAVYPYAVDADGNVTELPGRLLPVPGSFSFENVLPLDLSAEFQETPTEDELEAAALAYISSNGIGVPTVSLNVSFVQLGQFEEYKNLAMLENVSLCDTVTVRFPDLGVSATAKVVRTLYNVLTGRYDEVEIGSLRGNIADTIAAQGGAVERLTNGVPNQLVAAIQNATTRITGNRGGYVVLHDTDGDGQPDELLVMDTDDINTATNVWRWNQAGLGFSNTGYTGTYGTAITADGSIVADFVRTGLMSAERITMGARSDDDLTNYLDIGVDANDKIVVTIGASDNQILLKIQNDRVSFFDTQGNELAFFSDNAFRIVTLQAFELQGLKISVLDNGAYGFMASN